jgi:PAS domain S-box-containing protein
MSFDDAAEDGGATYAPHTPPWLEWIAGQGEIGARVAAFDWSTTPLGPIGGWPGAVRNAVMLCLGSLFPMALRLGEDRITIYNDACRDVYGPERFEDALGRPTREVWPETAGQLDGILDEVAATGRPFFATDLGLRLNRSVPGEECYFTFCYSAVVDDETRVIGILSTFVETTTKVLADRRLRTLERLGRELSAGLSDTGIAELAMRLLAENSADHPAGALCRLPAVEGRPPLVLAGFGDGLDCTSAGDLVAACVADRRPHHGDGGSAERVHAFPVLDPEDRAPSHVLLIRHHPARPWDLELEGYLSLVAASLGSALLTQAELWTERQRVARATALDTAKSAFFAGVSHELTTPLTLISAPLEHILEREADLDAEVRQDLVLAQASVARLARMVEAMLDFSRLEAGRLVPRLLPTDVAIMVRGMCAAFAPALERLGLEFAVDVPALPRTALIDRDFLERIVLNLLSNAAKFTAAGTVGLSLAEDGDGYSIEVADTGPGIDADDQYRVFTRFERLRTPPGGRGASGAGIGLAMVRQLTELLGGSVRLESAPGAGSRFTVRLPFEPPAPLGVGQSITPRRVESFLADFQPVGPPAENSAQGSRPRLLVAEDDAQLARFLGEALADTYAVTTVGDGEAALASIRAQRPDVVLTDVAMPGMDGLELVRRIRQDPAVRDLAVLLLSARAGADATAAGLDEGADDYIAKPFTLVDLRARLAANLERARVRSTDAAWRRAAITAITDGLIIFDTDGLVLETNEAFTDLLGFGPEHGPFRPPYPWWPTEEEDAEALAEIVSGHRQARQGVSQVGEYRFFRRDRRPVWVRTSDAQVLPSGTGLTANVRTLRDVTREREARERRVAAAQVSADFASVDDLDTLLTVAQQGLGVLFDGGSTIQLRLDEARELVLHGPDTVTAEDLPEQVRKGLGGQPSPDTTSLRPGILLVPRSSATGCRAWVQFPKPRRIGPDEMIVADLLAQAFALAVDRIVAEQRAADREANLQVAMESHRLIGQAIGILVERHRLTPGLAFARLRTASQNRNLKLREVARRVIETGVEPEQA